MAAQHQYDDDQTNGIIINIVPELRRRLKIVAAENNLSVQEYVEHVLARAVHFETSSTNRRGKGLNRAAVDRLLQTREAIKQAHPGQVFEDSAELIHQAREERTRELEQR
jgi:hypothetical protein